MKSRCLRLVFGALVAIVLTLNAAAQTQLGQIKAAKVEGEVFKIAADNTQVPLHNGDLVIESDTIQTGGQGSVVLVFQTGSTVRVAPGSKLKIEEFKMDPLAEGTDLTKLTAEPSPSQTKLDLVFGEIVGNVKKLSSTSNYNIKTPAGAAGIRGTTFMITFRPSSDGSAFDFKITTTDGRVVFHGTASGAPEVNVPAGTEITVKVNVDASGAITIPSTISNTPVSDSTKSAVDTIATEAAKMTQDAVFSPTPPAGGTGSTDKPATETKQVDQTPTATKTTITLTQGAGGG